MKPTDVISVRSRFSRSVNIERDGGANSLVGYIPTGRALDVVRRLAQGMLDPASGRALSITGPHGGGKSSLAVFIEALLNPKSTKSFKAAFKLLDEFDPILGSMWIEARNKVDKNGIGFSRAIATATREPISKTILRSLHRVFEANEDLGTNTKRKLLKLSSETANRERLILDFIKELSEIQPIIFIIDEFGKNLEAYADLPSESDPFILQAIAEFGQGENALPIFVITMQHLSFDDYIQSNSSSQRKEWAKIQGRFQDIPYVDSPLQSRRLISSVFENRNPVLKSNYQKWLESNRSLLQDAGLTELAQAPETLNSFPLHPLTLAVLPQLCSRFGQNERTLFSFLASNEKHSVASFLKEQVNLINKDDLKFVGLDRVYDYFLESAPTMLSASSSANRWIEIESRIRDVHGVSEEEESLLKIIGVLNLITSGGNLRASKPVLLSTNIFGHNSNKSKIGLETALKKLEKRGLIVYREFADEYRVWQGSDFDLRSATESARRQYQSESLAVLLNRVVSLPSVVAGRASQEKGILRVFEQRFFDPELQQITPLSDVSHLDGIVAYSVTPIQPDLLPKQNSSDKPILYLIPRDVSRLRELAIETASLYHVLESGDSIKLDWVAKRELIERYVSIKQKLAEAVNGVWIEDADWVQHKSNIKVFETKQGLSSALSEICDEVYFKSPRVASEMIARRELTGQGTRARRRIIEAMLDRASEAHLGIEGFGPDRAIYEAILRSSGMHSQTDDGSWTFGRPLEMGWSEVWDEIDQKLSFATDQRLNLYDIYRSLARPPFGIKEGVVPLLLMAAILARKSELALYEHGTLVLNLNDAVAERLAKNPTNFAVRNYATAAKSRFNYIKELVEVFKISKLPVDNHFMSVATALYREIHFLPVFTKSTTKGLTDTSRKVRDAFIGAVEPDILIFQTLPVILGFKPFLADSNTDRRDAKNCANALFGAFEELSNAYMRLMSEVAQVVAEATAVPSDISKMRLKLTGQANNLEGRVLEKSLNSFVVAILRDSLQENEWLENLAMVIADGSPTRTWNDESVEKFKGKAHEIGGNMRRLQALLYDRLSLDNQGFDAARVTVTFPNGKESIRIVGISDSEKNYISNEMNTVFPELESRFGSASAAKSALLAWLTNDLAEAAPEQNAKRKRDHG